ncbi:MAG: extracellular solute-binding protein [Treponema sp.]|jgi:maltose-binding protein MalE|nr:extracellular solute-binding protein [Treponema sp.]
MKKTKRTFAAFAAALAALWLCAGCAKKDAKETLELWVYDNGRIAVLGELGKQYEAEYGVRVNVSLVDLGQIRNQFLLASGGAECADLAIIPHDNLGPLVENGAVMRIAMGDKAAAFLPQALEAFTYNGGLYGAPLAIENIGFFWNTALAASPPETWADLAAMGEALVKAGKAEVIMGLPDATYHAWPLYASFGGAIFGRNADGGFNGKDIQIAGPGFVDGLAFLSGLAAKRLIPQTIDWDGAHVLFESGRAPFIMAGPWALNRFRTAGVPYAIGPFPAAAKGGEPGRPFLGVQGIVISAASPRALLAQSFALDFIATGESMQAIYEAEQRPSAWKDIFDRIEDADVRGFNAAGARAEPMPAIPEMGYVWDAWVAAAALAFSGEKTPSQALQNAQAQIESQIQGK